MKCKAKRCELESGHAGRCGRLTGAINGVANDGLIATNADSGPQAHAEVGSVVVGASVSAKDRTQNRRSREDYNAYMKRYMKERRAGRKPLGIAYG